ncbi:MAG TPA: hypothetical protein VGO73_05025 [Pyrinomonadaceae bacterium]|nr:hypothetical protein [Pyrinomonadaceae bacterium]
MTEASLFYQAASTGLGNDFLDDVQRVVDSLREHPYLGHGVEENVFAPLFIQLNLFSRGE